MTEQLSTFRLRGSFAGEERCIPLRRGENRIGWLPDNDIVLPATGVSRRHATVSVGEDRARIEDLDSKNGTRLNGSRVTQAELVPGDRLEIGASVLLLEEVEPGDVTLALRLDGEIGLGGRPFVLDRVPTPSIGFLDTGLIGVVEAVVTRLAQTGGDGFSDALRCLADFVGARGALLGAGWEERKPVVLGAWGSVAGLVEREELGRWAQEAHRQIGGLPVASRLEGEPPVHVAFLAPTEEQAVGLVVVGSEKTSGLLPLLRALLQVMDLMRDRSSPRKDRRAARSEGLDFPPGFVAGSSAPMLELYRELESVAGTDVPVLLVGETGVGKELLGRTLHRSSPRAGGPFVAVNCAAVPQDLAEAEMFGIRRRVATGVEPRAGKFELADGGVLFLDEIGETPPALQAKLLRALQDREIQPVGGTPRRVDVRVVCATNADLTRAIAEGRFRDDLYYRIAGRKLRIPPLRRRREDIPLLAGELLRRAAAASGKQIRGITLLALERLTDYPWPGNVRQLEHEIQRLVHRCPEGEAIDSEMLDAEIRVTPPGEIAVEDPAGGEEASLDLAHHVERLEARLLRLALARSRGAIAPAARLVGLSRNGFKAKCRRLGIRL